MGFMQKLMPLSGIGLAGSAIKKGGIAGAMVSSVGSLLFGKKDKKKSEEPSLVRRSGSMATPADRMLY